MMRDTGLVTGSDLKAKDYVQQVSPVEIDLVFTSVTSKKSDKKTERRSGSLNRGSFNTSTGRSRSRLMKSQQSFSIFQSQRSYMTGLNTI